MADEALTVTISAPGADAAAAEIADLETRLAALEKSYTVATTAVSTHAAAIGRSTIATRLETEAATGLSGALDALATHYRIVASGAEVFGLEATAASGKVAALTEVVEGLEAAAAPLLIAMVALEAAFQSFEYLKDAVETAGKMQAQIETLGAAVDNQGGKWDEMAAGVGRWVDQEAMASGITRAQLVPALNALVTAGNSVADSEKILAVAEEVAIAKHKEVGEVVNLLIGAEMGRGIGLERLDANTRKVIQSGGTMSDLLRVLHADNQNQVSDGESLERSWNRVRVEFEGVALAIGDKLLPALTDLGYTILGGMDATIHFGSAVGDVFNMIAEDIKTAGSALSAFSLALADLTNPMSWKNVAKDFQAGMASSASHSAQSDIYLKRSQSEFTAASGDWAKRGRHIAGAAVDAHAADTADLSGLNQTLGSQHGSGFIPGPGMADQFANEVPASAIKNLDSIVQLHDKLAASEEAVRHSMEMSTNALDFNAKALDLKNLKAADAIVYEKALNDAVYSETVQQQRDVDAVNNTKNAYEAARAKLNDYNAAIPEGTKLSAAQKETQKDLEAAVTATSRAHTAAETALTKLNTVLNEHTGKLNEAQLAVSHLGNETTETTAKLTRDWNTFYDKSLQKQKEDLDTFGLTNTQKIAYYQQLFDSIDRTTTEGLALAEQAWSKHDEAVKGAVDDMQKAYKTYVDNAAKQTESFIDDVVIKHKTLKDEIGSIYGDILKAYIDMVAKMVVQSALFKDIFPFTGESGKTSGGIFGSLTSGGSSAGQGSYTAGALNVHVTNAGPDYLSAMTGNPSGVSPSSITALINSKPGTSSGVTGEELLGIPSTAAASAPGLKQYFGGAVQGATAGSAVADMVNPNGNQQDSAIGGALGGIAAIALHANPLIGLGIDVVGSLLGGLFGGNQKPVTPDPLQTSQSDWQSIADMQGMPFNAPNGATYLPQNQYYTANGGTSQEISTMTTALAAAANPGSLTDAQKTQLANIMQISGGSGGGLGITNEWNDNGTSMVQLQSGITLSLQALQQDLANFNQVFSASVITPLFTITHSNPDFNRTSLASGGNITTPQVAITVNGSVVGSNGMNELATTVSTAINQQQNGTAPSGTRQLIYSRSGSGF